MDNNGVFSYNVQGGVFTHAGDVAEDVQKKLAQMDIDVDLLRRVALALYECEVNLVIHANGGTITVSCRDDVIEVEASDNGPGISDVEQAKILGYSTASADARAKGFGAGKGFSIMQKYADYLDISSERGRGTVVRMRFNRASAHNE